jgi:hypothetical protein
MECCENIRWPQTSAANRLPGSPILPFLRVEKLDRMASCMSAMGLSRPSCGQRRDAFCRNSSYDIVSRDVM